MPFYSFEMVLVGIILLSVMSIAGIQIWLKRKKESQKEFFTNTNQNMEHNEKDF